MIHKKLREIADAKNVNSPSQLISTHYIVGSIFCVPLEHSLYFHITLEI